MWCFWTEFQHHIVADSVIRHDVDASYITRMRREKQLRRRPSRSTGVCESLIGRLAVKNGKLSKTFQVDVLKAAIHSPALHWPHNSTLPKQPP